MVPVVLLTDGFLGNGTEPWKVPKMAELPSITPRIARDASKFKPYQRDPKTLAREWAFPGMDGFQHRVGGLEKDAAGNVSHDPANHQLMCEIRRDKVEAVVDMIPQVEVVGENSGKLLVVGWGGTLGHLDTAVRDLQSKGTKVSLAQFNYIKPLPSNTAEVFSKFDKIIVCELNLGQFVGYLRDKLPDYKYHQFNKIQGLPFTIHELSDQFIKLIEE